MSKIYCKNCRWMPIFVEFFCRPPIKNWKNINPDFVVKDDLRHYKPSSGQRLWADEWNKQNDCSHYKRKWWKFWADKPNVST